MNGITVYTNCGLYSRARVARSREAGKPESDVCVLAEQGANDREEVAPPTRAALCCLNNAAS